MNKRMLLTSAIVVVATLLIGAFRHALPTLAEAAPTSGDCDGSGSLDSADVISATTYLFANDGSQPAGCNANGDGVFDSADIVCIQRLVDGSICEPANQRSRLGTNLTELVDFSPEYTFIDAFKQSRQWTVRESWGSAWGDPATYELIDLSEDGYVQSLPDPTDPDSPFMFVGTFMFKDINGMYPAGQYHVYYDGEGTLGYGGDVTVDWSASTSGHHVLNVVPSHKGIELTISQTDPNDTGDYIRNIRVIMPGYTLEDADTQIFHDHFLDSIAQRKTLRFMDWMRTNHSTEGSRNAITSTVELIDPEVGPEPYATYINGHLVTIANGQNNRAVTTRIQEDYAHYSTEQGVPAEVMVALANKANVDPWFNMPHLATDAWVTDFAALVRDELDPTQRVYVEYSNETWNGSFSQKSWIADQGMADWPTSRPDDSSNVTAFRQRRQLNWYGKRTHQVCEIWEQVFAGDSERVVCLVNAQANNVGGVVWLLEQMLECPLWADGPCDTNIDAVAIAPYIGHYISNANYNEWHDAGGQSGALDTLFTELLDGGVIASTSAVNQAIANMNNYAGVVVSHNIEHGRDIELISYEGGQHLDGGGENSTAEAIIAAANNDDRMKEVYDRYLAAWPAAGGHLFVHFNNTSPYSTHGAWGAQESYTDTVIPKIEALNEFNNAADCHWDDCSMITPTVSAEITLPPTPATTGSNTLPVNLKTNGYDVSSASFALSYDTSYLTYQSATLAAGLSAEFDLTITDDSGLLQVAVYAKDGTPTSLPEGQILNLVFNAGSNSGTGVTFVTPQASGGSTMQPVTCGDDFGRSITCTGSGTALNLVPTAITIQQSTASTTSQNLIPAIFLAAILTTGILIRRRNWQA